MRTLMICGWSSETLNVTSKKKKKKDVYVLFFCEQPRERLSCKARELNTFLFKEAKYIRSSAVLIMNSFHTRKEIESNIFLLLTQQTEPW